MYPKKYFGGVGMILLKIPFLKRVLEGIVVGGGGEWEGKDLCGINVGVKNRGRVHVGRR